MYYALSDSFAGDLPREHTHGFANTKTVICFATRAARAEWLTTTKLQTARALTRAEAVKLTKDTWRAQSDTAPGTRQARIYGTEDQFHVLVDARS